MNILAIGDIVGATGVDTFLEKIDSLKEKYSVDFCIVNGENASENNGISRRTAEKLLTCADMITLGNHSFRQKDAKALLHNEKRIIRPANYPDGTSGSGVFQTEKNGKKIAVINLIGRTDMNVLSENPFTVANEIVEKLKNNVDIIMIDFHAEATAEKIAMAMYLDGKITALYGTHTHVQTADEYILEKGTGYISDIGMTGPKNSVIGMDPAASIKRFVTSLPERYKLAEGSCMFNACIFEINDENCRVLEINRINLR